MADEDEDGPSERVGDWTGALIKGTLEKEAVSTQKQHGQSRYFALTPPMLLYYESARDSVFKPKGAWCPQDCRGGGLLKRTGLGDKQAVLLRGHRELVLTAESRDELRDWNRAIQAANRCSPVRVAELEALAQELREEQEITLVQLELARTVLHEEQTARARERLAAEEAAGGGGRGGGGARGSGVGEDALDAARAREAAVLAELEEYKLRVEDAEASVAEIQEPLAAGRAGARSVASRSIASRSIASRSIASRSIASRSIADGGGEGGGDEEGGKDGGGGGGLDTASFLRAQVEELRSELHREVEARREADILREAALRAQLELQDMREDMAVQLKLLQARAVNAAEEATRLRGLSRVRAQTFSGGGGDEEEEGDDDDTGDAGVGEEGGTQARDARKDSVSFDEVQRAEREARLAEEAAESAAETAALAAAELEREQEEIAETPLIRGAPPQPPTRAPLAPATCPSVDPPIITHS
jgi:hypothetical protein